MQQEWFIPGRYDMELGMQPGTWTMKEILTNHAVQNALSLGPSTGINEYLLAAQHPETIFTLIESNRSALEKVRQGIWPMDDETKKQAIAENMKAKGFDRHIELVHDGFRANQTVNNLHTLCARYPIPLDESFDICMAFNALPVGIDDGTCEIWKWAFDRIKTDGLFVNEWGVFTKTRKGIQRLLRDGKSAIDDHVERIINEAIFRIK